jgi:aryl-alcohol dehydrogenase-like predicted oxidoreductase
VSTSPPPAVPPPGLRPFGRTGLSVSALCLGAMNFGDPTDDADSIRILDAALDGGINFVDTADVYAGGNSERILGAAFEANGRRDEVVLATKVGMARGPGEPGRWHRREHIVATCDESLRRLRTDHVDLLQLHRPSDVVPQEETLAAFDELIRAGKVRYVGCSTHPAWMVMEALATSERLGLPAYVSEQPPYNLLDRRVENELLPLCRKYGLAVIPWSPLAAGILAGRYPSSTDLPDGSRATRRPQLRARVTAGAVAAAEQVGEVARELGVTPGQLALLWLKDQPDVTSPIVGPRTLPQLQEALAVLSMSLDEATSARLDEIVHPGNAVADFHNSNGWMRARIT